MCARFAWQFALARITPISLLGGMAKNVGPVELIYYGQFLLDPLNTGISVVFPMTVTTKDWAQ
jgi:hypothetical protein